MTTTSGQGKEPATGFDAAVTSRECDKLNRWPFAKEIYGIATTGPQEWSVRIGIYGEWGTGKSSVLSMINRMALRDDHLVVPFNPWQFSDKKDMWHAFVQAIIAVVPRDESAKRWNWRLIKKPAAPFTKWISLNGRQISEAADNAKIGLPLLGIELLRDFFLSNRKDFELVRAKAGNKRIIILIDDLDRTNPLLIPEMLFALKEIMDVPGLAFICAFDPFVIGQVLGDYHRGLGDGLKFLEKVIDYPRWLPTPTANCLSDLALHEAKNFCPYVLESALRDVVALLPANPRSIRQFIRLLALLRIQVQRHRPDELNWPIILAANVVKIRFPQLAHQLLGDKALWDKAYGIAFVERDEVEKKLADLTQEHVERLLQNVGLILSAEEKGQLCGAMLELAKRLDAWGGVNENNMVYQLRLAEAPAAVTWKEYDSFVASLETSLEAKSVDRWIKNHSEKVDRNYSEVFSELFEATINARQSALGRAADAVSGPIMKPFLDQAIRLMKILELLTFDLQQYCVDFRICDGINFEAVLESLMYYAGWTNTPVYREFRQREADYLCRLLKQWNSDLSEVISALKAFSDIHMDMESKEAKALHHRLCEIIVPQLAEKVLDGLSEDGFVERVMRRDEGTFEIRCILLDANRALWKGRREDVLRVLSRGTTELAVHLNAYKLLDWIDYKLRKEDGFHETESAKGILKDRELCGALWKAATAQPLNIRAIGSMKDLPDAIEKMGTPISLPEWWVTALQELPRPDETKRHTDTAESEADKS